MIATVTQIWTRGTPTNPISQEFPETASAAALIHACASGLRITCDAAFSEDPPQQEEEAAVEATEGPQHDFSGRSGSAVTSNVLARSLNVATKEAAPYAGGAARVFVAMTNWCCPIAGFRDHISDVGLARPICIVS